MNDEGLIQRALAFHQRVAAGDFSGAARSFDAELTNAMPADRLRDSWRQLEGQYGAFREIIDTRSLEDGGNRVVTLSARFESGVLDIDIAFDGHGLIHAIGLRPSTSGSTYRAPGYVTAAAFREIEVTVGHGRWALPGTLSIPLGEGPFPAAVLVHGSGPQDRDESIGPNKIFRDIAWGLASRGIAVLRYEKRTKEHAALFTPEEVLAGTVKEEVTDDAHSGVELLRHTAPVDPMGIYIIGHSLGATLAPRIAEQDPEIAGIVALGGLTRPLEDTILDQITYLTKLSGEPSKAQLAEIELLRQKVARVKSVDLSPATPPSELPLGLPGAYWLSLRGYEPAGVAARLRARIFIVQCGRDYQVTEAGDFPAWKRALEGSPNATLRLYPELSHALIAGEGPPTPQDYLKEGHVSERLIRDIAEWITS